LAEISAATITGEENAKPASLIEIFAVVMTLMIN
jgi:hypothetical protein